MKIILTGATGFLGKYVHQKLLESKHQVYVISRKPPFGKLWYQADILNHKETGKIVQNIDADVLVHLAWDVTHGEFWNSPKNIAYAEASKSLFDYFLKAGGKKIISAGTCAEYPTSDKAISENAVSKDKLTQYGYAKREVYDYLNSLIQKSSDLNFTWLRIFGIYGPGENEERFFPKVIRHIKYSTPFEIKTPDCFMDYVYVKDVANFISSCLEGRSIGAVNIGTGESVSLLDLYNILKSYIETKQLKIFRSIDKPNSNSRIPDCNKVKNSGFYFSLAQGFSDTVQYFSKDVT